MSLLAAIRPTSWDYPLFLHVLGAMVLVGGLVTAVGMQLLAWRRTSPADTLSFGRAAFRALLLVALPGWIVMRVGAQWIYSKEGWSGDNDPTWLGIGFGSSDIGGIVLLVAIVAAGFAARRTAFARAATLLTIVAVAMYLVTVWAMSAKPA
jgi:nitrate reductase gamma subunit